MAERGVNKWMIVFTVVSASLLQMIDTSIVNVSLAQMMGNLGATLDDISWVVTGYTTANVIMMTLSGWLTAKLGRKLYFTASIIVFTIGSIFCGTATTVWALIAFRAVQGIGGGGLMAPAQAILIQTFPREEIGLANSIFGLGVVIGPTIGPVLGGYITDNLSWHWIFFVNIPFGILATVLSIVYIKDLHESDSVKVGKMDWLAFAMLILCIGSLQTVLEKGESAGWFGANYIVILTIVAVIAGTVFVWKQVKAKHPMLDVSLLRFPRFAVGTGFGLVQGFGLYASVFIIPIFCQTILGYTAEQTGLLLMPAAIVAGISMPIVGQIMKHTKISPVLLAALGFISFILFVWMLSGMNLNTNAGDFFLPLVIRGLGMGLLFIPLVTITLADLPTRDMPQGTAFSNMIRQLGGSFGIALMAAFIDRRTILHFNRLASNVTAYNPAATERLHGATGLFMSAGNSYSLAHVKALDMVDHSVLQQSLLMTYNDAFLVVGIFFAVCLPLLLLFLFNRKKAEEPPQKQGVLAPE